MLRTRDHQCEQLGAEGAEDGRKKERRKELGEKERAWRRKELGDARSAWQ
jgi:hypothetical protein